MKAAAGFVLLSLLAMPTMLATASAAEPRHGVITSLAPITNRGDDENPEVERNRKIGRVAGIGAQFGALMGRNKMGDAGLVAAAAAPDVGAKVAEKIGGPGPTTRYMVKVKLDNRKVLSITQLRRDLGNLKTGDRIVVTGKGDAAKISKE